MAEGTKGAVLSTSAPLRNTVTAVILDATTGAVKAPLAAAGSAGESVDVGDVIA